MDLEIFRRVNWRTGLVLLFVALVIIGTIVMVVSMKSGNVGGSDSESQNRLQATTAQSNATSVVTTNDAGNIGVISIIDVGVPRGTIVAYNSSTIVPPGWALCDGENGTPDLRGRFILGAGPGPSLTARTLGAKGGAETVALKTEEMPPHVHAVMHRRFKYDGGDHWVTVISPTWGDEVAGPRDDGVMYSTGGKLLDGTTQPPVDWRHPGEKDVNKFATFPHENMPPFYVLTYIMKL
jgi:microcystin-dependent protein